MLSLTDLKKYYVRLYSELRNYVWDFETIRCIANLEIATYNRFPNINEVRSATKALRYRVDAIAKEDEDLANALSDFDSIVNSSDTFYSQLIQPREV